MSTDSVNNDDKRAQNYSRVKKEYDLREARLKQKQQEQLNRLNQAHAEEIRNIEKQHAKDLESYRVNNRNALTKTEAKYQKDIQDMQEANRKKSMQDAEEQSARLKHNENEKKTTIEKNKQIHDSQMKTLNETYERNMSNRNNEYADTVKDMKESQRKSIQHERESLTEAHNKEMDSYKEYSDNKINNLGRDLQNTRDVKGNEITTLKTKLMNQQMKASSDKIAALNDERKMQQNYLNKYKSGVEADREALQRTHEETMLKQNNEFQKGMSNMRANTQTTYGRTIAELEREVRDKEYQRDIDKFNNQIAMRNERTRMKEAHRNELESAEDKRKQIVGIANERSSNDIKKLQKDNMERMTDQRYFYEDRIGQMQDKYAEDVQTRVLNLQTQNDRDKRQDELRDRKVERLYADEKAQVEGYFKDVIDQKEKQHKEEVVAQRDKLLGDLKSNAEMYRGKIRSMDTDFNKKLLLQEETYMTRMNDMQQQHKNELQALQRRYQARIDEMDKTRKFEVETQKAQSAARENQIKEQHNRQMEQMRVSHMQNQIKKSES